jgi:transposase, IS30 family
MCIQHREHAHLAQEDRFRIETLLQQRHTYRSIARMLTIDVSVISRECARNREPEGSYCAVSAQKQADLRRNLSKRGARKIEHDPVLAKDIEDALRGDDARGDWSPEVIANVTRKGRISHTTIYAWIRRERSDLRCFLPHQGQRRKKYGSKTEHGAIQATKPRSIEDRPKRIEKRIQIGHYEGDTVILKEGRIHTLVERHSRLLISDLIRLVGVGLAMQISDGAIQNLSRLPSTHRRTITYDRGSEFAWWDETEKHVPGIKIYFAHPYHPWERGTNERTNGLIRRYFPKGQKFVSLTTEDVANVVWRLNHRPRKILRWRTPCDVFGECCVSKCN